MTDDGDPTGDDTASGVASSVEGESSGTGRRDIRAALEGVGRLLDRRRPTGDVHAHARRLGVLLAGSVAFATSFGLAAILGFGLVASALGAWTEQVLLLLLPAVTVAYLVLLDGREVARPSWPDGHPPLADAWLVVAVGYGVVASVAEALAGPALAGTVPLLGWETLVLVAFVAGPPWFARRLLRPPSWTIAVLGVVVVPMVPLFGFYVRGVAGLPYDPLDAPVLSVVVAALAAAVPFAVAALAPDPATVARGTVDRSRRLARAVAGVLGDR